MHSSVKWVRLGEMIYPTSPCWSLLSGRSGLLGQKYTGPLEHCNWVIVKREKARDKNKVKIE